MRVRTFDERDCLIGTPLACCSKPSGVHWCSRLLCEAHWRLVHSPCGCCPASRSSTVLASQWQCWPVNGNAGQSSSHVPPHAGAMNHFTSAVGGAALANSAALNVCGCSDIEAIVLLLAWLAHLCRLGARSLDLTAQEMHIKTCTLAATGSAESMVAHSAVVAVLQGRLADLLACTPEALVAAFNGAGLQVLACLMGGLLEGCIADDGNGSGVVLLAPGAMRSRIRAAVARAPASGSSAKAA